MKSNLKQALEKMHYEIVGKHTALEICSWTKKSLLDEGVCYKQQFYGIRSHMCCQMSPATGYCNFKCRYCWRPHELNQGIVMPDDVDEPKEIIEQCIIGQRRKLSGFGGNAKINQLKFKQAQEPMHFAISLTGEPTLYPKLPELIQELHSLGKTTFLVTNGSVPEMLKTLQKKDALPTQLYISIDTPQEKEHKQINIPLIKNSWRKINQTLELLPKLNCRKVLRITLIKGMNDSHVKQYAELIKKAAGSDEKTMVEVKAYMWMGYSRKRMKKENMPYHKDILDFSEKLANELGWKILDQHTRSRVCLLCKNDFKERIMSFD